MEEAHVVDETSVVAEPEPPTDKPKRRRSDEKKPTPKIEGKGKAKKVKKDGAKKKAKPSKKAKGPRKRADYVARGVAFQTKSPLARSAHQHIRTMLNGLDPKKVVSKFKRSKSWYVYIRSARSTPSLERFEDLANKLGYEATLTIRKKG